MKHYIFSISFLAVLLLGGFFACTSEDKSTPEDTKVTVTGITLDKTTLDLKIGAKETITATVSPVKATDKSITWTSSKISVATVSNSGEVTAVAVGSATITVKTTDGNKTATAEVTVTATKVAVTGISLDKTTLDLKVGAKETLTPTIVPTNAADKSVTWTSDKVSAATVSSTGEVTAIAKGTAIITVKTTDGNKTATATVNVSSGETVPTVPTNPTALGTLIYNISQSTSKALPAQADINKIMVAKIIFRSLKASSSATIELRYVKTDGVDTNDGTSWTKAKRGIKSTLDAITDASANKIYLVLIGSGIYTPAASLSMKNHVAIIGGFKASSEPVDSYDKGTEATTISGDDTRQVFTNNGLDDFGKNVRSTAVLVRVTVTKGKGTGRGRDTGGGMFNFNSSPTITQVTFSNNSASFGGGMYNSKSSPTITQVTFSNNSATVMGGGMYNNTASPFVTQVTFSNNSAGRGGGMYITGSGVFFNGSRSEAYPAIYNGVTFVGNSATYTSYDGGGGLFIIRGSAESSTYSPPIISSTIFWGNTRGDKTTSSQLVNTDTVPVPILLAHSVIQGYTTTANGSIITTDPSLGSLADNNGFVQTTMIGATSSAKDKGLYFAFNGLKGYYSSDNTNWYSKPTLQVEDKVSLPSDAVKHTTDARGYGYSGRPDMGAYEQGGTAAPQ